MDEIDSVKLGGWEAQSFCLKPLKKKSLKERKLSAQFEEECYGGHIDGDSNLKKTGEEMKWFVQKFRV